MRVVRLNRFGGPEVLETVSEEPQPLAASQLRIGLEAIGVNRADVLLRTGKYHGAALPAVPGLEAAGRVSESSDPAFSVGDRVLIFRSPSGLYREEAVVPSQNVVRIPETVSPVNAAALPINGITAWYAIHHLLKLQRGESMLLCAAASGVGTLAVQIASQLGATVIAGASTDEKLAAASEAGATHTINYGTTDLIEAVRKITPTVDTFLDIVGGPSFATGLKLIGSWSRVVALANVTTEDSTINTRDFYPKNASIFGLQLGGLLASGRYDPRADLSRMLETLTPRIHAQLPLSEVQAAHRLLESREVIGKLVLVP
jgi:NADPH:quinone reductase